MSICFNARSTTHGATIRNKTVCDVTMRWGLRYVWSPIQVACGSPKLSLPGLTHSLSSAPPATMAMFVSCYDSSSSLDTAQRDLLTDPV